MQEAYCLLRNKYSLCCSVLGRGVLQSWLGGGCTPVLSCPRGTPFLPGCVPQSCTPPPACDWGTSTWEWVTPCLELGYPQPETGVSPQKGPGTSHWGTPRKYMEPVEVLRTTPSPGVDRHIPVKTVPSPSFGCGW